MTKKTKKLVRSFLAALLIACLWQIVAAFALAQQSAPQSPNATSQQQSAAENSGQNADQSAQNEHHPTGIAGELAKETREAEGEEEENANLKHSTMVQKLAKVTGLSVHGAHLLALGVNFAIIVFVFVWFGAKNLPGIFRKRNEAIQKALEEARAASREAKQRLTDIENRLRQMDVEIGRMQASSEKEAEAEETRIQKAAEDEMRKVVEAAEQEIAAAAKQARRELSVHTADLAVALARKQISIDANTDQVLVRDFAAKLAANSSSRGNGGKDGR